MADNGGSKILISTPVGSFHVWTKKVGDNPRIKVLLLHGGPGGNHQLFQTFEKYFPQEGFEFYYYNQLGSYLSDQPTDEQLWAVDRFVDEVEQVRQALRLNKDNFYLLGHSWGGILALEYALTYQHNLKGLIISNMMSSAPEYQAYADTVLAKQMDPNVLATIRQLEANKDFENPEYDQLLHPNFYVKHFCRLNPWPKTFSNAIKHLNQKVYVSMQGPSEFGISGLLKDWTRKEELSKIVVPTLTIGAQYDTMDPDHMKWMSTQVQNGTFHYCPNGSHCAMWDDEESYFTGLVGFIKYVDKN